MNKTIHNITTGEVVISAMTQDEIDKVNSQAEILKTETAKVLEKQAVAETAKTAAQAKLAALGLTTDDLAALGL